MSRPIRLYPANPPQGRDTPDHWSTQAACGVRTNAAYADLMSLAHDSDRFWAEAKAVCRGCPVRAQCRADSIDETRGIWGGLDPDQRKTLRNRGVHVDPYAPRVCGRPGCETIFTPAWRGPRMYCGEECRTAMRNRQIQDWKGTDAGKAGDAERKREHRRKGAAA